MYGHKGLILGGVPTVAFSPDGRLLASGSADEMVLWNPQTGEHIRTLGDAGTVRAIAFSPDGQLLASGAKNVIHLWA
jgi:WD40 repeat protein